MNQEVKILSIIGGVTLFILVLAVFILSKTGSSSPAIVTTQSADPKILVRGDSNSIKVSSASATLIEFGDFQCPACYQAFPIVEEILKENKVNFVFRNFPLSQHQNAKIAAEAAEAAGAQGKYWEMYQTLYSKQNDWADSTDPLTLFTKYAKDLGLNTDQFSSEVKTSKYEAKITSDISDGNAAGVNATPTFYLNNKKVDNLSSWNDLKTLVDSLKP